MTGAHEVLTGVDLRDADGKLLAKDMTSIGAMNLSAGNYTAVVEGVGDVLGVFTLSFGPGPSTHQSDSTENAAEPSDAAESDSLFALPARCWPHPVTGEAILSNVLTCRHGTR